MEDLHVSNTYFGSFQLNSSPTVYRTYIHTCVYLPFVVDPTGMRTVETHTGENFDVMACTVYDFLHFLFLDISLPGRGSIKGSVHHYTQRNPESKPESPKKAPQETLIPSSKA